MGNRADFYAGRGLAAIYLGSLGRSPDRDELAAHFAGVQDRASFDERLAAVFAQYGELPAKNGWPWPWNTSATTDHVVAFDEGRCWMTHYSKRWAPVEAFNKPTATPCVFPDLLTELRSTPSGRLSHRLRHGTEMNMGSLKGVMASLLCHVGTQLSKMLMHLAEKDGSYYVLQSYVNVQTYAMELQSVAAVLEDKRADFELLLAESLLVMPELPWDLLTWLREQRGILATEPAELTLGPDVQVYFGAVAPEEERNRSLPFVRFTDVRFPHVFALLQKLMDVAPVVYAQPLAEAMCNHAVLPVPRQETDAWLNAPQPEFGNKTLLDACSTAEGRAQARAWAAGRVFRD